MNDKEYRDLCAMFALQVFLKDDIERREDKQQGRAWIAEQAYKMADVMLTERNSK